MSYFHSREEAFKHIEKQMRCLELPGGEKCKVWLEVYLWDDFDFITGRKYGHPYMKDEQFLYYVIKNAEGASIPFELSLEQMVRYGIWRLTGKVQPSA